MRILVLILLACAAQLLAVDTSTARGRGVASQQELHFVSSTTIPGADGAALSLCHLTTKKHVLGIGIWRSSDGYALSAEKCEGEQYIPFTEAQFGQAQQLGLIEANQPSKPVMTMNMIMSGFAGSALIGLLLVFALFKYISSQRRKRMRRKEMGDTSSFHKTVLDVMCHAALSDGTVDNAEVTLIQKVALDLTGRDFKLDEIENLVRSCDKTLTPAQYKAYGKGLDATQRVTVMRAALMVVSADNDWAKAEKKFVSGLATGLGISNEMLEKIIRGE